MKQAIVVVALAAMLGGCAAATTATVVSAPQLKFTTEEPRAIQCRPFGIRRETTDRYAMNARGRNNLRDCLSDTTRYMEQQRHRIELHEGVAEEDAQ